MTTTVRPWKVVDTINTRGVGYLSIRGPNGEKIADMFPFAGEGGIGVETARANASLICQLANQRPEIGRAFADTQNLPDAAIAGGGGGDWPERTR